jgi:integrase
MRDTGMRDERELYEVRIDRLDFDRKVILVPDSKTPAGRREIPMSERAHGILRRRCGTRTEGWLFPSKRSQSGHLTTVAKHFREARQKAELPEELVLYCGRHDFGTHVYAKTGNLKAVMAVMGHKDVKTAMRYQHSDLESVRAE